MSQIFLSVLLVSVLASIAFADLSCLDRDGNSVAWFTFIEYPGNVTNGDARYAYLDDNLGSQFKVIEGANPDDEKEPFAATIETINNLPDLQKNLLVFSNVLPNGTILSGGAHAKAIVAYDNETLTGVYILHTYLAYPDVSQDGKINYTVPKSGSEYAENNGVYGDYAYCMSIDKEILGHVLLNLPLEQPNVYYASGLFQNISTNSTDNYTVTQFNLLNGDPQWLLTKSPNFVGAFYENVVVRYFDVSLAANSYGRPYSAPSCPPGPTVVNVNTVKINDKDQWNIWADNSKWAVSILGTKPHLVCLSDMDRTDDQFNRGGSAFCSGNVALFEAFSSIVAAYDICPKDSLIEDIIIDA